VFIHLLGPGSFESLKGLIVHKQASLSITFDGVRLIVTLTIAPITYLRNWALIVPIIVVRFMVN
jgi:hypothetical protein